jgi:hypothetical protein
VQQPRKSTKKLSTYFWNYFFVILNFLTSLYHYRKTRNFKYFTPVIYQLASKQVTSCYYTVKIIAKRVSSQNSLTYMYVFLLHVWWSLKGDRNTQRGWKGNEHCYIRWEHKILICVLSQSDPTTFANLCIKIESVPRRKHCPSPLDGKIGLRSVT